MGYGDEEHKNNNNDHEFKRRSKEFLRSDKTEDKTCQ